MTIESGKSDLATGREAPSLAVEPEDIIFMKTQFPDLEGWCLDEAAYLSLSLMKAQTSAALDAGILEIGVYRGKYLGVLYQRARRTSQIVVGIDLFQWSPVEVVSTKFVQLFGSLDGLKLVTRNSLTLDAAQVIGMLGGKRASFISVDGDHRAASVRSDMILAKAVLSEGGIIAVDDFLNSKAIGVGEGFYRFMLETGEQSLRPFAYCMNKLFCADLAYHEIYRNATWAFAEQMRDLPQVQEFHRQHRIGLEYVEYELLGSKILIF